MEYTNSPLAEITKLSPMHSGQRKYAITRITPHVYEGQVAVEQMGQYFSDPDRQVSCNYCIGKDGRIGLIVEEKNRSWCSSNADNDGRAVTIECASEKYAPYAVNQEVFDSMVNLCEDICRRYGKIKLLWIPDKAKALAYTPAPDEMMLTVHQWFFNTSCPGGYMMARMGELAERVTALLANEPSPVDKDNNVPNKDPEPAPVDVPRGLQASELIGLSNEQVIQRVGALFTADQEKSGILASVSLAQFCLETGYGQRSDLVRAANNGFGMKCQLSGNTWPGSTWDGESKHIMNTQEQRQDGTWFTIQEAFRKYPCIEDSISDHSAYLLGAMNGNKPRYAGLAGCMDYKQAAQIIRDGGYATSLDYVDYLCKIIEMWDLTKWDCKPEPISMGDGEDSVSVSRGDWNAIRAAVSVLYQAVQKYEG